MARSYVISYYGSVGNATNHQLGLYQGSATGTRPKLFEFGLGSYAVPVDQASRFTMQRSGVATPTGGAAGTPLIYPIDYADPAALVSAYYQATGGQTMQGILGDWPLHQKATYRWVASPGREYVVPNVAWQGLGLVVSGQSAAYATDLTIMWEE